MDKGRGEEGAGEMNGESSMEAYTLTYAKQPASGNLLYDAGSTNLALCENPKGWDGVGGGSEVQEGGDMYTHGCFVLMNGRNQQNPVKQLSSN